MTKDGFEARTLKEYGGLKIESHKRSIIVKTAFNQVYLNDVVLSKGSDIPVGMTLSGDNINLPDGNSLIRGTIKRIEDNGWNLEDGAELITVNKEKVYGGVDRHLYTNDLNFNPGLHEDENYFYTSLTKNIIHTKDEDFYVEYQPGHKLFDMTVHKLIDGKLQYVADNEQYLIFYVKKANHLEITDRKKQNKVPLIEHPTSAIGDVTIEDSRNLINIKDGKIHVITQASDDYVVSPNAAAFQLETSNERLRINSEGDWEGVR